MLESSPDLSGTTSGSLAAMERGAQRMVKVIDDLLLLSKVGDPDNPIIARPVDLRQVVDDVIDLVGLAAQQKRIDLRVELPDEPVLAARRRRRAGPALRQPGQQRGQVHARRAAP